MKAQAYKSNLKNEISSLSSQNSVIKMKSINLLKASTNPLSFSNSRDKSLNRSKSKGLSLISPRSKPKKFENTTNPSKIFLTHVHQEKKGKKENICKNINKKMTHNKKGSSVNPNSFFNNRRIKAINKLI